MFKRITGFFAVALFCLVLACGGKSETAGGPLDKIKNGMTYEEIEKIIGSKGEASKDTTGGGELYTWDNVNGNRLILMFKDGKLVNKMVTLKLD
ncbi:MAG: hypothetical protein V1874_09190 [Spirochaetota bacterium]